MRKLALVVPLAVVLALVIAACGGSGNAPGGSGGPVTKPGAVGERPIPTTAPLATPTPAPFRSDTGFLQAGKGPIGPAGPAGAAGPVPVPGAPPAPPAESLSARAAPASGAQRGATSLEQAGRQIIANAGISVEVEDVIGAVAQVRAIAEGAGGLVQQLSSSGGPERPRAVMVIRVPQPEFFNALDRLATLGKVLDRNVGSDDVTEQFIDLEARLKSAQREEENLLNLLNRAQSVSDVLTIERELSRIRSDIERLQGQLNFLKRRVDLATITVILSPPQDVQGSPPAASLGIATGSVTGAVDKIKATVASLKGAIDSVSLSVRDGDQTAKVRLRVFRADFDQAVQSVESLGKLLRKDTTEGVRPASDTDGRKGKPDAAIDVGLELLRDEDGGLSGGAIGGIAAGSAAFGVLLLLAAYHLGRRGKGA